MRLLYGDRWLDMTVRVVGLLVVGSLAFLAYTVWQGERQARETSIAARAISNLEEAVRQNPDNPLPRVLLGDALRDTGDHTRAIEQYNAALELSADYPAALSGLAVVAMHRQEWRTAEGYWQKAIEVLRKGNLAEADLRLEKAYYYYGLTLIEVAEYEDAVAYLKEALRIRRSDADTHYALSVAYARLDSPGNQRKELEAALAFVPSMPEANYDLGLILKAEGDEARAAELFRASVDNAPGRPEPRTALDEFGPFADRLSAASALAATDKTAALVEARIARALDPRSVDAAKLVARLYGDLDMTDEARIAWRRVREIAPSDQEAQQAISALGDAQ